ncbi:MAG: TIGR00725 family protein [Deltaproteobacteria bacterium]|nr:TIGR00725 family protein [Deltaproteobacteria bacterium]
MRPLLARKLQIAVVGDGKATVAVADLAKKVGSLLAQRGAVVVCGGLGGVMEAAASGATAAGGLTVGILPTYDVTTANASIAVTIPSGMGHARNVLVVSSGHAVIAFPGAHGTRSEISLALKIGKTVIGLQAWGDIPGVQRVETPEEAVELALRAARAMLEI